MLEVVFDRRGWYTGVPPEELRGRLRLPSEARGREDEYQRRFTVRYGVSEPQRNRRGALVVHALWVEAITVAPEHEANTERADKSERHAVFVGWMLDTFGEDTLRRGSGVLDVAGGRGEISSLLAARGIPSSVVEPDPRAGAVVASELAGYRFVPRRFDEALLSDPEYGELLAGCSFICAMHPDQATDLVVEHAVARRLPFACVPCCVFNRLFPHRRLRTGQGVSTYAGLVRYLCERHPGVRRVRLPFAGCNVAVYMRARDYGGEAG